MRFSLFASYTSTIPDLLADIAEFALKNSVCFLRWLSAIFSLKNSAWRNLTKSVRQCVEMFTRAGVVSFESLDYRVFLSVFFLRRAVTWFGEFFHVFSIVKSLH